MALVVDASLVLAALAPSQEIPEARHLVLGRNELFGPVLLRQEVTNALFRLERRGQATRPEIDLYLSRFQGLEISLVDREVWVERALGTARRFAQSRIYDAMYLACAEDLDAELWTCDRRFVASFGAERPARLKLCPEDIPDLTP